MDKVKEFFKKYWKQILLVVILIAIIVTIFIINRVNKLNRQISMNSEKLSYQEPYIPSGFSYVEGRWNTGFVIREDSTGNEFVWIPVDGTTVKLQRKSYSVTEIEKFKECSETLDVVFEDSVKEYGGYYVGRYESGVPTNKVMETPEEMNVNGKPVSIQGAKVWNNISYANAKTSAEQMYGAKSEITSSIMNSYAYDTMLTWIESSGYNIETDSKDWGNYSNNSHTNNQVEITGKQSSWKANNIYDLAGNVAEWTSEAHGNNYVVRGGSYYNDGNVTPAAYRESAKQDKTANNVGFRVLMYKTGNPTIEGYNDPYIPSGFTHTEGEWNTGFVIKEEATGNEFVWIPVDGYNLNLERSEFENSFNTMSKTTDNLEFRFKQSVYSYGGYYVGRYEAGIGEASGNNAGVPVSKKEAQVWTGISRTNAKQSAELMYGGSKEISSKLMNSYAYDTMTNWLKKEDYSVTTYNVDKDSSTWGNYKNNTNSTNAKKVAGSNESWKANNIYDLAGNVWEWTTENYGDEAIARGGDYLSNGDVLPAGTRDNTAEESTLDYTGFRVLMYKDDRNGEIEPKVAAGFSTSFYLDSKGTLWSWGEDSYHGQLGRTGGREPNKVREDIKFIDISASSGTVLAIDEEGNIWSWGNNSFGQLGLGTTGGNITLPQKIDTEGIKFKKVSSGEEHSLAIDEEGNIWSWGHNYYGQLGLGTTGDNSKPVKLELDAKFTDISASNAYQSSSSAGYTSYGYSVAIDEEGNIWSWGANNYGQLGNNGISNNVNIPTKIDSRDNLKSTKFTKITTGNGHCMAIDTEGRLWAWGANNFGQLGCGSTFNGMSVPCLYQEFTVKEIAAGNSTTYAITEDGYLYGWGNNKLYQLGVSGGYYETKPIQIGNEKYKTIDCSKGNALYAPKGHFIAIDENGDVWGCGNNEKGQIDSTLGATVTTPTKILL